ncbi:aminotransferase IV [Pseudactinotalea sp. HY160]|uniref:aminotransferase class IV n=1 Tax=Pseudactinotalea sp. HY160 TaxID=2654490 RepID=UPI00128BAEBB|nr:aminotransferase class IV [Pseudactinotalea sp. HY160]MPV49389.1 aminotransferase IV [Pseudactinotalea sp. HY160]
MFLYAGGRLIDPDTPVITASDHGVLVGDGAFETCELIDGRTFALTRHLDRLESSVRALGLAAPDRDEILAAVAAIEGAWARAEAGPSGRLRITWTSGPGPMGSDRGDGPATLLVSAGAAAEPRPVRVRVSRWVRNERSPLTGVKSISYAENVLALADAKAHGAGEAILANTRGELCEGTGTNVFVEHDGRLLTPALDSGALAGVTRALVLEWAREEGVPVAEATLPLDVIRTTNHAALSSSTRGLVPIVAVDDRELAPGDLTRAMAEIFRRRRLDHLDP